MKNPTLAIDKACEDTKGHTNWAYADTVTSAIITREINKGNVIIFFDDPANEDGEYE